MKRMQDALCARCRGTGDGDGDMRPVCPDCDGKGYTLEEFEMSVEDIRERYTETILAFRRTLPTEETGYYVAVLDIGRLLDEIERLEDNAHQEDLANIAQRNELELLRADNLQRRSEDVYYGRNRPGYDPRRDR